MHIDKNSNKTGKKHLKLRINDWKFTVCTRQNPFAFHKFFAVFYIPTCTNQLR